MFQLESVQQQAIPIFLQVVDMGWNLTVKRPRETVPTNLDTVRGHGIIADSQDCGRGHNRSML